MTIKQRITKLAFRYLVKIITPEQEIELDALLKSSPKNQILFQEIIDRMTKNAMHWRDLLIKDGEEILEQVFKK